MAASVSQYEVLDAHQVLELLGHKMEDVERVDARRGDINSKKSYALLQAVYEHAQLVADGGAQSAQSLGLYEARLRLADADDDSVVAPLWSYERAQIANLMPASDEEALVLIPTLARFNRDDLRQLIGSL